MSLRFKTNLLEHTKAVGRWALARGVHAHVRATDLALVLQQEERALLLSPSDFKPALDPMAGAG